jgi:hypothetical protein
MSSPRDDLEMDAASTADAGLTHLADEPFASFEWSDRVLARVDDDDRGLDARELGLGQRLTPREGVDRDAPMDLRLWREAVSMAALPCEEGATARLTPSAPVSAQLRMASGKATPMMRAT